MPATTDGGALRLRSEDEAWDALSSALRVGPPRGFGDRIVLERWPKLELTYWVPGAPSVVTPPIMRGLLEFQHSVTRSRQIIIEGTPSLRRITSEVREKYEIKVKVSRGSSHISIDLTKIGDTLIKEMVGALSPEYLLILGLGALLVWGGNSMWRSWLQSKRDEFISQTEQQRAKDIIEAQKYATDVDLRRWEIFAEAMGRLPEVGAIEGPADQARNALLKAAGHVTKANFAGAEVTPFAARKLSRSPRRESEPDRLDGSFRVQKVDTTVPDGFRVTLAHESSGEVFVASVRDRMLSDNDRRKLRRAEWKKLPIEAEVNIVRRDSEIIDAVVRKVIRIIEDEEASA